MRTWTMNNPAVEGPIITEIMQQSDRAAGLIAAEFVGERLKEALVVLFKNSWAKMDEDLFSGHGPLATLSAKINIGHALGIIGPETYRDLHLARKIRNEFAHNINPRDFATPAVASWCAEFHLPDIIQGPWRPPGVVFTAPRDRYLFVASYVMSQLIGFTHIGKQAAGLSDLP